jgi:hypothetical protein
MEPNFNPVQLAYCGQTPDGDWEGFSEHYDFVEDAEAAAEQQFGAIEWVRLHDDAGQWIVSIARLDCEQGGIRYESVTVVDVETLTRRPSGRGSGDRFRSDPDWPPGTR